MHIERLYADGFRNLDTVELYPQPRFNVLTGDNGQGKTNILEAIWLLSGLRSFRTRKLSECVHFDKDTAELAARVRRMDSASDVGLRLAPRRNTLFIDGKQQARGRDFLGRLVAVLFTADDLRLPHAEPAKRRRYLDRALWTHDRAYVKTLRDFEKALAQRNGLLKNHIGRGIDPGMLAVFDDMVSATGAVVALCRERFVAAFSLQVQQQLSAFGAAGMSCGLRYDSKYGGGVDEVDARAALLAEGLLAKRDVDRRRGFTSVGPHHDDMTLLVNERPARLHASQGQCRALVLAMKIAELRSLEQAHGEAPLLLMDDVSSELDKTRNAALMHHLDALGGQVFLTTTDAAHILVTAPTAIFDVAAGRAAARKTEPVAATRADLH